MGEKIIEIEREDGAILVRFHRRSMPGMPESVRHHVREARREMLLALRNMIDVAVEASEEKEKASGRQRTKVEVE